MDAVKKDMSPGGAFDQRNQLEQSALTGAGVPSQIGEFAARQMKAGPAQRFKTARIAFTDVIESYHYC